MRSKGYIPPPIKNRTEWGFVCGRISALEGQLLTKDFFRGILEMRHTDDIFQHFQGSLIEDYLDPGIPWEDFSAVADECFYDMAVSIRNESPSPIPADLFLVKNDYLNIKSALAGISGTPFPPGVMPREKVEAIMDGYYSELPPSFSAKPTDAEVDLDDIDPSVSDVFIDGAYMRHLYEISEKVDSPMIHDCIDIRILGYAITSLWRILRQDRDPRQLVEFLFAPEDDMRVIFDLAESDPAEWPAIIGGEIGDLLARTMQASYDEQVSTFELKVINFILHMVTQARKETSGPERVFAFLSAVEAEMQNLKLVVTGKINRIDADALDQRLRYIHG